MIEFKNAFEGDSFMSFYNAICNDSNPMPTTYHKDFNTILSKYILMFVKCLRFIINYFTIFFQLFSERAVK